MQEPALDLPDATRLSDLLLSTRIMNALLDGGITTIGEVRDASDTTLLSFQGLGMGTLQYLRLSLGKRR